ncbi:thioredoxin reductase [Tritrichomonas foetus]|uniref:Thioredoxin reductase n=1 Tax=Tritrichomonas foetus TaxID=1144522 RepID=A0A1J4KLJ3_9EUKA|nr:thioredoxin reductase [Tritrichomonas foetus]|eukprot:OHT10668.1 thioredoxin reductase [Tritrichomonas foetus]
MFFVFLNLICILRIINEEGENILDRLDDENKEIDWDQTKLYDSIIIGSGPAGSTAGLYLGRARFSPLIFHGHLPGGQLMLTTDVENFPTFKGTGPQLVQSIQQQARESGAKFVYDEIVFANLSSYPKKLVSASNIGYRSKTVILATGANARYLGLTNEKKFINKGISTSASLDGYRYTNKSVAVVGGGDTAITEALTLTQICKHVTLIHRTNRMTASMPMQMKLKKYSNITIISNSDIVEIIGDDFLTGIQIKNQITQEISSLEINGLFIAIGRVPAASVFADEVGVDKYGYFLKNANTTETRIPGVFVAGDCADNMYRQAITSAGTGCQAALDSERYLKEKNQLRTPI